MKHLKIQSCPKIRGDPRGWLAIRPGEIPKKIQNTISKSSRHLVMAMESKKSENKSWQAVSVWISIFSEGHFYRIG